MSNYRCRNCGCEIDSPTLHCHSCNLALVWGRRLRSKPKTSTPAPIEIPDDEKEIRAKLPCMSAGHFSACIDKDDCNVPCDIVDDLLAERRDLKKQIFDLREATGCMCHYDIDECPIHE